MRTPHHPGSGGPEPPVRRVARRVPEPADVASARAKDAEKAPVLSPERETDVRAAARYHVELVARSARDRSNRDRFRRRRAALGPRDAGLHVQPAALNSRAPINSVAVLEDQNGDGV